MRDKLRIPFRSIVALQAALTALYSGVFYYINLGGYEAAAQWTTLMRYCFMLVFLALAFLLIKDSFPKLMFTWLLFLAWQFMASRYLMLFGACYTSFVGLKVLETSRARTRLEESLRYADRSLLVQKKQFDALAVHMDETRKARHDLRQHLAVVQSYEVIKMAQTDRSLAPSLNYGGSVTQ